MTRNRRVSVITARKDSSQKTPAQLQREVDILVLTRDAESPELWSDADLDTQIARYLKRWPGRGGKSVRLFGAMMAEQVERRRASGEVGSDAEIEDRIRLSHGST